MGFEVDKYAGYDCRRRCPGVSLSSGEVESTTTHLVIAGVVVFGDITARNVLCEEGSMKEGKQSDVAMKELLECTN